MSDYRRYFVAGGTYFFTLVTEHRARLFDLAAARRLLGHTMRECLVRYPVQAIATVLLPDHLHTLWTLPDGGRRVLVALAMDQAGVHARLARSGWSGANYIHYNPVKHGLVRRPRGWEWSTFHRWVRAGHYDIEWGAGLTIQPLPGGGGE
jgi:putative transposase